MFAMAPTDIGWYTFFVNNPVPNEVNFWTPTPWNVRRLKEGDKFIFLLKAPYRKICGYGTFKYYENLSIQDAWSRFGIGNGVESLDELRYRSNTYVKKHSTINISASDNSRVIGCIVLTNVNFFGENDFINSEDIGIEFSPNIVKLKYFEGDISSLLFNQDIRLPEEILDEETYIEGARKSIIVNAYERNPNARQKCIEYHGYNCVVCNFNFFDVYGEIGKGFIHVHHLKELNQIGEEYIVDPIQDLRPVCPNCHAMLHRKKPSYSIEELKYITNFNK